MGSVEPNGPERMAICRCPSASNASMAWREALAGFADPARLTPALYQSDVAGRPRMDGALAILERLGVHPIRGSGGSGAKSRKRGGMAALREMLRQIAAGKSIALTADVPKVSRIAGSGIVTLAQFSGRPIYPVAVVSSRRIDLHSWDRASIALPFGRGAMAIGKPILVPRDADEATLEQARIAVEDGLNEVHERAYGLVGSRDPGALAERLA